MNVEELSEDGRYEGQKVKISFIRVEHHGGGEAQRKSPLDEIYINFLYKSIFSIIQ